MVLPSAWSELRHLPRRVWVVASAALVNRMGTMALPFMTLYLTRSLGWSATRAGAMVTLYGAVSMVMAPLGGRAADRWGTRRLMIGTLAAAGIAMLLFPLARSFPAVVAMTLLVSFFTESFRPANMTAVGEGVPPARRKQAFALQRAAVNLGMSVGPALGGLLATVSFPLIWLVDGATALAAAGILAAWLEDAPRVVAPAEPATRARGGLFDPRLFPCLLGTVAMSAVFFQHEAALPLHLVRGLGLSARFFGLLFTWNTILIVALEIPLNHATSNWPHRRTLIAGAILMAAGFGGYGFCSKAWHCLATTTVWTFGEMVLFPGMNAYVSSISPPGQGGTYIGLYMMAFSIGFAVGPWAGAALLEHLGPGAVWSSSFVVGIIGALLFWRVPESNATPSPASG